MVDWLVGNAVFSETALRIFVTFCMKSRDYKGRKKTEWNFWKKNSWFGDICEKVSKLAQNQTLWYFSQKQLTIFLVFGLKLVLNMTFNLNETYFSEKFPIWRYLTLKSLKNCPNWGFGRFLDFASLVFLDFTHMIGGHDVYLFLYYSPVQSMYSCSIYNKSTFFSSHFFAT